MTTRNFRVNNGISIGDVVIDATTNKITGLSVTAPSADGDVATKKYVDDSLSGLSQNSISQGDSNVTVTDTGTGNVTIDADGSTRLTVAAGAVTVASGISFVTDTADINGGAIDGAVIGANSAAAVTTTALVATTADINAGTVDNTVIGGSTAAAGTFTTLTATSGLTVSSGTLTVSTGDTSLQNLTVYGNLTVEGTETIVNSQQLAVEDSIISMNNGLTSSAAMPRFSGIHAHRGTGSALTEQDPYFVWDDQFADDGTTIYGNTGGAWTALVSVHQEGSETPNSDFTLADIRANVVHAVSTSAQYADIAERFAADAPMAEGAVVMLGGEQEITETITDKSPKVFGVVSTKPAYMMNAGAGNNDSHPFVAMTGRTPVRVTGTVNKGDRLVSSSIKGTARAASENEDINPFHVIGRALESKTDDGIGMVNCVVRTNN